MHQLLVIRVLFFARNKRSRQAPTGSAFSSPSLCGARELGPA